MACTGRDAGVCYVSGTCADGRPRPSPHKASTRVSSSAADLAAAARVACRLEAGPRAPITSGVPAREAVRTVRLRGRVSAAALSLDCCRWSSWSCGETNGCPWWASKEIEGDEAMSGDGDGASSAPPASPSCSSSSSLISDEWWCAPGSSRRVQRSGAPGGFAPPPTAAEAGWRTTLGP